MDRNNLIAIVIWAFVGLGIVLGIDMVVILLLGFWHPPQILLSLSGLTFFETGFFLFVGGAILMVGGFPSLGKALGREWTPKQGKKTRELSYTPLVISGLLFFVSILTSLIVYGLPF